LIAAACGDDSGGDADGDADTTTTAEAAAEAPEFPAGTPMAEIQANGTLRVGTKFDQPLFGLRNPENNEIEGFDAEIAKLIAQRIFGGTLEEAADSIEFKETPSRIREDAIVNGDVDIVVATYTINDARKERIDFAGPYYVAGQDIMVRTGETGIEGVEDLNGKKVCTVQGSTSLTNVQTMAPQADLSLTFDTYSLCAEALADGRVEAVTTDNVILVGLVEQYGGEFELVGNPFTEEPYGIGLTKGAEDLRTFLNDTLEEIYESGEWAEAYERTVGVVDENTPEPPDVDRY
jgi:glutamate transport system substrate-binding protein